MDDRAGFSPKIMRRFAETLGNELKSDTFMAVLDKAGLPVDWAKAVNFGTLDNEQTAYAYSKLQDALRTYYGRGARGILMRIGGKLWERMLEDAPLKLKAQSTIVRGLPTSLRRKPALELLARLLSAKPGDVTVHTLDLDMILVDHVSPTTLNQADSAPICFVNLGLIRECMYWAVGYEHDVEEISCRALGAKECEFKVTVGG